MEEGEGGGSHFVLISQSNLICVVLFQTKHPIVLISSKLT